VLILANGRVVQAHPRHTAAQVLIDRDCYGPDSASAQATMAALYGDTSRGRLERLPSVVAPTPLGRMDRASSPRRAGRPPRGP
jgi:hypothetical protein